MGEESLGAGPCPPGKAHAAVMHLFSLHALMEHLLCARHWHKGGNKTDERPSLREQTFWSRGGTGKHARTNQQTFSVAKKRMGGHQGVVGGQ